MTSSSKRRIAGWLISGLIALMLVGSATAKLLPWEKKEEKFAESGYSVDVMYKIAVVEIIVAILFLVPQTAFIGAILLTGFLGGATATHVRIGQPFIMPVVIGVLAWIGLGLRNSAIFPLAWGRG